MSAVNPSSYADPPVPGEAIFVAADEPLLVFPSAAAAERKLEAMDVDDGVYPAAYGPRGEPYSVGTFQNRVVIEATGEPERPDELEALLRAYLHARGEPAEAGAPLDVLVAAVWRSDAEFWQEHDPFEDRFGTRFPLWGCLLAMLALGLVAYVVAV